MPTRRGKSVTTTITLPAHLYLAVKKLPAAKCQSFSSLVRNLLIEEVCGNDSPMRKRTDEKDS